MVAKFTNSKSESSECKGPMIELKEIGTPILLSTTATTTTVDIHPEPPPPPPSDEKQNSQSDSRISKPKTKKTMAADLAKALALRREAMGWDSN